MKKIRFISALAALLLCVSAMTVGSSAAMKAVGDVSVPYGKPVIDGTIKADEWASAVTVTLDSSNMKAWQNKIPADFKAVVKALWDETGLYLCGEVTDSTFGYSKAGGYSGDAFQVSLDMGQVMAGTTENRAIFYSWGCYEGTALVQRQESKNNAVVNDGTDGLAIKTVKADKGWRFEACLTFAMLKNDIKLKSGKDVSVAAGLKINAMFCYLDRTSDGKAVAMFGTTKTDEAVAYDWGPKDHGVTFTLAPKAVATTAKAAATTAKAAASTATKAAQTADMSLIVPAMTVCLAAAGWLTVSKKRG